MGVPPPGQSDGHNTTIKLERWFVCLNSTYWWVFVVRFTLLTCNNCTVTYSKPNWNVEWMLQSTLEVERKRQLSHFYWWTLQTFIICMGRNIVARTYFSYRLFHWGCFSFYSFLWMKPTKWLQRMVIIYHMINNDQLFLNKPISRHRILNCFNNCFNTSMLIQTAKSTCLSVYLHEWLSFSLFVSVCLPFSCLSVLKKPIPHETHWCPTPYSRSQITKYHKT